MYNASFVIGFFSLYIYFKPSLAFSCYLVVKERVKKKKQKKKLLFTCATCLLHAGGGSGRAGSGAGRREGVARWSGGGAQVSCRIQGFWLIILKLRQQKLRFFLYIRLPIVLQAGAVSDHSQRFVCRVALHR